jgi:hypothetical protein
LLSLLITRGVHHAAIPPQEGTYFKPNNNNNNNQSQNPWTKEIESPAATIDKAYYAISTSKGENKRRTK